MRANPHSGTINDKQSGVDFERMGIALAYPEMPFGISGDAPNRLYWG